MQSVGEDGEVNSTANGHHLQRRWWLEQRCWNCFVIRWLVHKHFDRNQYVVDASVRTSGATCMVCQSGRDRPMQPLFSTRLRVMPPYACCVQFTWQTRLLGLLVNVPCLCISRWKRGWWWWWWRKRRPAQFCHDHHCSLWFLVLS